MKHAQPHFVNEIFFFYGIHAANGLKPRNQYAKCAENMSRLINLIHPVATMIMTMTDEGKEKWARGITEPKQAAFDVIRFVAKHLGCPEIPVLFHGVLNLRFLMSM